MSNDMRNWINVLTEAENLVTCPECGGRGWWREHNDHQEYCRECNGEGKVSQERAAEYYERMDEVQKIPQTVTTDAIRAASARQLAHEIEWCKKEIAKLTAQAHEKPSIVKQIKHLERLIKYKELTLAFEYNR